MRLRTRGLLAAMCRGSQEQPGLWVTLVLEEGPGGQGQGGLLELAGHWHALLSTSSLSLFNLKQYVHLINYKDLGETLRPHLQEGDNYMDWDMFRQTTYSCLSAMQPVFAEHLLCVGHRLGV